MMSIQYFLTGDAPVIWRGPLIHSAIQQFLRDVEWGELDYLVVDLPPGTGDAALSHQPAHPAVRGGGGDDAAGGEPDGRAQGDRHVHQGERADASAWSRT